MAEKSLWCHIVRNCQKSTCCCARKTVHGEVFHRRHSGMKLPQKGTWGYCCCVLQEPAVRIWGSGCCLHSRNWTLKRLPVLQVLAKPLVIQEQSVGDATLQDTQDQVFLLPFAMSLYCPLLTMLNMVPADKGNYLNGQTLLKDEFGCERQ